MAPALAWPVCNERQPRAKDNRPDPVPYSDGQIQPIPVPEHVAREVAEDTYGFVADSAKAGKVLAVRVEGLPFAVVDGSVEVVPQGRPPLCLGRERSDPAVRSLRAGRPMPAHLAEVYSTLTLRLGQGSVRDTASMYKFYYMDNSDNLIKNAWISG